MHFHYSRFPAGFEIPDDWWVEAGMLEFVLAGAAYCSTIEAVLVPLREIEPPVRSRETSLDWHGFSRKRLVSVLSGIATGAKIAPVRLFVLPPLESWEPSPFRCRVIDGFHRFHAAVAAGFEYLPAVLHEAAAAA